jgi:RimJ/RimL family protein N-acetyltransferase/ribosomal protein S18 acetylase RimI-like enzyme
MMGGMVIRGKQVNLRDRRGADYEDYRRWFAPGQAWQQWDAPWEAVMPLDEDARQRWESRLARTPPEPRAGLEIETVEGRHIGWVNSYWVDEASRWRDCGIVLAERELWGRGLGHEAFALWVGYLFNAWELPRVGMGTWSGNERMLRVAARVGMREEARFADARLVEGQRYDAVRWGVARREWERCQAPRVDGLRRYTPVDWDAVVELTRQLFDYHRVLQGAAPFSTQEARDTVYGWLAGRETVMWVWQEAGEIVGLARARHVGVFFFEEFVVAEGQRGQGIGTRFVAALEAELRADGERDIFLSMVWPGNPDAIDFYRRRGYDVLNTFELRKGLDRDRRGREIRFLGRRFCLGESVPGDLAIE